MADHSVVTGGRSDSWPAPAKINRFLHITGRRADGYHELQTLFQFLDFGDEIDFEVAGDGQINTSGMPPDVPAEKELCFRAARLLQQATGCPHGARIHLIKRLPMGGGLGGGSSDAATVLVALNRLWQLDQSTDTLARLGLSLGADVPVFVRGHAAWGEGVGERLTPVDPDEPWMLVIKPQVNVSTAEIFAAPELTRHCTPMTIADFSRGRTTNVCEPVVRSRYGQVGEALDWLSGFSPARMTGTGSCVFAPFATSDRAQAVLDRMPRGWTGFVAKACNRSPLLDRAGRSS